MKQLIFNKYFKLLGALLTGALLYLCYGNIYIFWLYPISLYIIYSIVDSTYHKYWRLLYVGLFFATFISLNYLYLYNIYGLGGIEFTVIIIPILIYLTPQLLIFCSSYKYSVEIFILCWLISDFAMAYLPIGNQLLQLGPLNAHFPLLIQWYKILGPAWGSFSVLLIPYLWYKLSKHSIKKVYPITISTFLLIINIIMYVSQDQEIQQKRIAGIVSLKNSEDSSKISSILIENSDEKVDYILIPEAVFLMDKHLYEFHPKITDIKRCLKDSLNNASLIMGLWLQDNLDYKYNVAIKYSPYNRNLTIRNKVLLVPFSEYIPSFLKKFDFITDNLKHTIRPMDNSVEFFFHNSDIISCLICYESLFTNYLCEKTLGNAQFFCAISSNTGTDSNHNETVSVNILKTNAVATNRYIARAAEHGISLIINPKGTITISSNYKTDYIIGKIYLKTTNTFYAIHHKTINYLYLGVVFILLICILIPVNLMYTALFAAS